MGAGLDPQAIGIIIAVALTVWLGGQAVKGTKVVAHKAKCGIERIVGKHCEEVKDGKQVPQFHTSGVQERPGVDRP